MSSGPVRTTSSDQPWNQFQASRSGASVRAYLFLALIAALFVWSYQGSEIRLGQLFSWDGTGQIFIYVKGLFPPELSKTVLLDAAVGAMETFAISFLGILMAAVIALSLVFFCLPQSSLFRPPL